MPDEGAGKKLSEQWFPGNTMLNDSTSHIAELMIKGNNRGLTDMWKIMNHHKNAGKESVEVAKELMDFEEKCIQSLKVYL